MFFQQVPSWLNKHGSRTHLLMALSLLLIPDCSSFSPSFFKVSLLAKRERLSLASGPGSSRRSVALSPGVLALRADVTVSLATPLGIIFEEVQPGEAKGLVVAGLVSLYLQYTCWLVSLSRYKTNACMLDTPMYSMYMLCTMRFGGPSVVARELSCQRARSIASSTSNFCMRCR